MEAVGQGRSALQSAVWTKLSPPKDALGRAGHALVYDSARENCLVFGGRPVDDHGPSFEDTGLWTGNTWVPVAARYARRGYVTAAFDTQRLSTIAYGGMDGIGHFADTWEFDGSSWRQLMAVSAPGNRSASGLVYDARRGVTVLFGGFDGRWKDDLWEWDGNTWTQRCNAPPCSEAPRPGARSRAVFVYDEARGVALLFGGSRDGTAYDDTWTWDGEQWAQLWPGESPMARDLAAAAYDPVGKRVLMLGGLAPGLQELNDFWAWDGNEWTNISQTRTPFARHGAGMAWDAKRKRGILFGGSSSEQATDAWEFHLLETPCASSDDCHVGTCVDGSCSTVTPPSGSGGAESGGGGGIFAGGGVASGGSDPGNTSGGSAGSPPTGEGGSSEGGEPGIARGGAPSEEAGAPGAPGAGGSAGSGAMGGAPPPSAGVSGTPSPERGPTRTFYSCAFSSGAGMTPWPLTMLACLPLLRVLTRTPGRSRRRAPKPMR